MIYATNFFVGAKFISMKLIDMESMLMSMFGIMFAAFGAG